MALNRKKGLNVMPFYTNLSFTLTSERIADYE